MSHGDDEYRKFPKNPDMKSGREFNLGQQVKVMKRDGIIAEASLAQVTQFKNDQGETVFGFMAIGKDFNQNVTVEELRKLNPEQ